MRTMYLQISGLGHPDYGFYKVNGILCDVTFTLLPQDKAPYADSVARDKREHASVQYDLRATMSAYTYMYKRVSLAYKGTV